MALPQLIVLGVIAGGLAVSAQETPDLSRYREYALTASLDAVAAASGARAATAKTVHSRPAMIQELVQRIPYMQPGDAPADPVREVAFGFYNHALYRIVVRYDRLRTEGLTNEDVVTALARVYGPPVLPSSRTLASPRDEPVGGIVVARWDASDSQLTLVRAAYSSDFELIFVAKSLDLRARSAIREGVRLNALEAPRRASEQRDKKTSDANSLLDRARVTNRAAFRP